MKTCIRVMKALSDQNRLKIIKMLAEKDLCVCEITALLGLAQPTVSKHLKTLEDAGLAVSTRDGSWVIYALANGEESIYARQMLENMGHWLNNDPQVRELIHQLPQVDRVRICAV